ncbi:MAG: LPS-assembly protein LptD [Acidobacteria bacterium]|nr:LPS-assembly protein LptD [Acidobacteriota bacterium]
MDSRTRLLITASLVCHLLLIPPLVTSQLLPSPSSPSSSAGVQEATQAVTIRAQHQERDGAIYRLRGNVAIDYGTYRFSGDEVVYNSETRAIDAEGHLVLEGGPNDEYVEAVRASYNLGSEDGRFEQVTGTIGLKRPRSRNFLNSSQPFYFTGRMVEKRGPDHYIVYDGTVTTCDLPHPKWRFYSHKVVVEVGGNANIYNTNFRLSGVPVLYLPFATHPVQKQPRQSGFLIPNIGRSSTRGYTFGESFFWKINRSMDLHAGAEYFSRRGWAPGGEFRARPSESSFADLTFFSVLDRGINGVKQGGTEAHLSSEGAFAHNFRGVADIDYLSSYVFRLAFSDVFAQAVNSEVKSEAFLSNTSGSFFLNASTRRYQDFQSTTAGDVITILHAPGFEVASLDRRLGSTPLHGSIEAAAEGLSRSEPSFSTAPLIGRFDLNPVFSLPLFLKGWTVYPLLSLRDTIYTQQLVPASGVALTDVGTAISRTLNRNSLEGSIELRPPALDRVFGRTFLGRRWKHVVEPRIVYSYVTGVENFAHILRFDERDILTDDNEVEYAVVNRFYAKAVHPLPATCPEGMPALLVGAAPPVGRLLWERTEANPEPSCPPQPATREVVTWELAQKYFFDPTFGGTLVPGRRNVFTSTVDLTGIAFLTGPRRLSPLVSRLRVLTSPRNDLEWDTDYDFQAGRLNTSTLLFNHYFGLFTVGAGNAFLHVPGQTLTATGVPAEEKFNQYRAVLGYGSASKRQFSGAFNLGFDARLSQVQYGSMQLAYNWDCCGVNLEYRRFALASVRNENQFRFTFALANVGAFGNLRRGERLF